MVAVMRLALCALLLLAGTARAELLESLLAAKSAEERQALIRANADTMSASVLPAMQERAVKLAGDKRLAEARRVLAIAAEAVDVLKLDAARPDLLRTEAMILGAERKTDEKLAMLRASRKAYAALEPANRRGEARCLIEIGREIDRNGDLMETARHFVEAVRIYRDLKDESAEGNLLAETAALLVRHEAFAQALPICDRAIEILARRRELPGLVVATRQRGIARMRLNQPKAALQDLAGVLAYREQRGGTPEELGTAMMEFGDCLVSLFRIRDARKTYGQLLKHARGKKLRGFEADVLLRIGNLEVAGSDAQIAQLDAARVAFVELKRPYELASCWNFLGDARLSRGEFQVALDCYRSARAANEHPLVVVNSLIGEVDVMRMFGRLDEAATAFEQAREACRKLKDSRWSTCRALMAGAEVFADRGENAASIKTFDAALEISRQLNYEIGVAQILVRRARELARQGDRDRAIRDYFQAIKLVPTAAIGAEAAVGAAEVIFEARQFGTALTVAREGVRLSRAHNDRSLIARAYLVLSRLLILGNDLELGKEAEQALAAADRIGRELGAPLVRAEATRLRAMAAAGRNDAATAERLMKESLELVRGQPARHLTWRIHLTLARIHEVKGELDAATASMRTAAQDLDTMRGALGGGEAAREDYPRLRVARRAARQTHRERNRRGEEEGPDRGSHGARGTCEVRALLTAWCAKDRLAETRRNPGAVPPGRTESRAAAQGAGQGTRGGKQGARQEHRRIAGQDRRATWQSLRRPQDTGQGSRDTPALRSAARHRWHVRCTRGRDAGRLLPRREEPLRVGVRPHRVQGVAAGAGRAERTLCAGQALPGQN